jgi:hypothetical protein
MNINKADYLTIRIEDILLKHMCKIGLKFERRIQNVVKRYG